MQLRVRQRRYHVTNQVDCGSLPQLPARSAVTHHHLRFLGQQGFDSPTMLAITAAIDFLCLGSAIEVFAIGIDRPPTEYEDEYPHLARAVADGELTKADARGFELALAALLGRVALTRVSEPSTAP